MELTTCNDFYKQNQNHSYCGCGSPVSPLVCDETTNNYPYCKCNEIGVRGQVCDLDTTHPTQIYYNYDDTHTPWSLAGDAIVGAYNIIKDAPQEFTSALDWIKKYGWIVVVVLGCLFALWIIKLIVEAFNTSKHFIHDLTSGESTEISKPHSEFKNIQ